MPQALELGYAYAFKVVHTYHVVMDASARTRCVANGAILGGGVAFTILVAEDSFLHWSYWLVALSCGWIGFLVGGISEMQRFKWWRGEAEMRRDEEDATKEEPAAAEQNSSSS